MFIQLKDLDQEKADKQVSVFILYTRDNVPLYISRSFADHEVTKYTSKKKSAAIIYFNRQSAIAALKTDFAYTNLHLDILRIPINTEIKEAAKRSDAIKRVAKLEARKQREPKPWK